ncbi:PucR family transcriptional regulator [Pseudomonas sp. SMV71]|uniref:PucR family transcriptional regulator n=1 Tax=Pseudomonas sp. SMV71 TaxID=3390195 RepID=UPI003F8469F8
MTSTPTPWPHPSEAVRELLRKGAELAQTLPSEWVERLNQALFSSPEDARLLEDPVILAACRRANRAELLHWANANLQRPGEPVQPYVSADMVDTARELARRGLSELLMNVARSTQNTAWELWMKMAFKMTRDPVVLEEFLDVSSRSIAEFIDGNMRLVTQIIREEKSVQACDDHVDKRSLVNRLLDGREVDTEHFGRRLGYSVSQKHFAYLVWSETPDADIRNLEDMARALARLTGSTSPLIVSAGPATLWVWCSAAKPLDVNKLRDVSNQYPEHRASAGSLAAGPNGFRKSHLEALATQRLMGRLAGAPAVATIDQVRMMSLITQDARASKEFVVSTLGRLATQSWVLQQSLHAFLAHGCNITQTAEALGTHRNTLLRRLERAQDLLPVPFADYRIQIAVALELVIWNTPFDRDGETKGRGQVTQPQI